MTPVFLDASGLIALVNLRDQWHDEAESVWKSLIADRRPLVTSSLVLIEIGDGLSRVSHRPLALSIRDRLTASSLIEVVQVTADYEKRGWELFAGRSDKQWSVTDCVSMVIMQERKASDVFTADHHFQQAGFRRLLTPN